MNLLRTLIIYIFSLLFVSQACNDAKSLSEVKTINSPVIHGWRAHHVDYPSIVALMSPSMDIPFCTGTLVEPDLVITAAHCAEGQTPDSMSIVYGYDVPSQAPERERHKPFAIIVNQDFIQGSAACSDPEPSGKCPIADDSAWNDVAVIVLNYPIYGATCAPILPVELFNAHTNPGNTVRIAGYGQNWKENTGKLYAGDVPVIRRTTHEIEVGSDAPNQTNACFGDSGGPIYVEDNGVVYVTGVTSRSAFGPVCGYGAVYSLPGSFMSWFESVYAWYTCVRDAGGNPETGTCPIPSKQASFDVECKISNSIPQPEPTDAGIIDSSNTDGAPEMGGSGGNDKPDASQTAGSGGQKNDVDAEAQRQDNIEPPGCTCTTIQTTNVAGDLPLISLLLLGTFFRRRVPLDRRHLNHGNA